MWRFEEPRLLELLQRLPVELQGEHAAVLAENGTLIAESRHPAVAPLIERSAPLFDAGHEVGSVLVQASLRELLLQTLVVALASLGLAAVVSAAVLHLRRAVRRVGIAMADQQERARITLDSIGDAVITTDTEERIDYANPVAERLMQRTLAELRGRPLAEVCALIDERTMQPMPTLVPRALGEGVYCPFSGRDVALIRADGSSIAIEDSAAPIRSSDGRIVGGAMVFRDVTATRRMAQRITWAATHDALTSLPNRREFEARIDAALLASKSTGRQHVVAYMDMDRFKVVNDSCGHAAGDALLKQLAELLKSKLRESDTLARLGGDEFGVLLEGCSLERARLIAADLLAAVRDYRFIWEGRAFGVGISIGLAAAADAEIHNRTELLSAADTACFAAKEQGRNRVCVFQSSDAEMLQRRADIGWATRLSLALERGRFLLYYQPYLALDAKAQQARRHIEVLLRLREDDGSIVLPTSFLPAAERYNIMPAIDRWVMRTVFARYRDLAARLGSAEQPLVVAINISATTINAEGTLDFIREQARLHELPAGAVCFELTETATINNIRSATQFMREVKAMGFTFGLDDFGVGSSSLAYLKSLPVDYLKIDGSFVANMVSDPVDHAMAETINRVGHIMGLQTVGEYAETDEVVAALSAIGVDYAQGFGVQRPQPLPGEAVGGEAAAARAG
jgi:diguanylate cyclase (GGDEF)-like protein/PAS domain S-box-containing protein